MIKLKVYLIGSSLTCMMLTACQHLQLVPHPIPVTLTPTAEQLEQRQPKLPLCHKLPKHKNHHKPIACLPEKTPSKPKRLFSLKDWF